MFVQKVKPGHYLIIGDGPEATRVKNIGEYPVRLAIDSPRTTPIRTGENPDEPRRACETIPLERFRRHDEPRAA